MDWNNDGKLDLISGDTKGQVWLFLNTGKRGSPVLAEGTLVKAGGVPIPGRPTTARKTAAKGRTGATGVTEAKGQAKIKAEASVKAKAALRKKPAKKPAKKPVKKPAKKLAGTYSKLHMADWDCDGLKDLLVGHSSTIIFYKNTGTASAPRLQAPVLVKIPEGKFPNRPSPYVVDWDGDGKKDLLAGTERGKVIFYRNIGTAKAPELAKGEPLDLKLPVVGADAKGGGGSKSPRGSRWRIEVTDWNNDGKKDILVGNYVSRTAPKKGRGGYIWLFLGK